MARRFAAWRREARMRDELALLDAHALRDLGIHRAEWSSIMAESLGRAESTRRRVESCAVAPAASPLVPGGPALRRASTAVSLVAAVLLGGCSAGAAVDEAVVRRPAPAMPPAADPLYLPGRFPPPEGPVEPLPAQF